MTKSSYPLTGANLIAASESAEGRSTYLSADPVTGEKLGLTFNDATEAELDRACGLAEHAVEETAGRPPSWRSDLLSSIAEALAANADQIVATADLETGLGEGRLHSELARTCNQLRLLGEYVRQGEHLDVTIDTEDPHSSPPRPDLRRMNLPIGPVAVFGASNFPLAFGVPGGDTASALAAGCAVVAKAHPSHPATSELTARAIVDGLHRVEAPPGLFSLIHGSTPEISVKLVTNDAIRAVGFTGSHRAGKALFDAAGTRARPIPVYAEMGSLNPVFITDTALAERGGQIAEDLFASMTLGAGQFCTKPGLAVISDSTSTRQWIDLLASHISEGQTFHMLNSGICEAFTGWGGTLSELDGVEVITSRREEDGRRVHPLIAVTGLAGFERYQSLREEHFGPFLLIVQHHRACDVAALLEGALAGAIHAEEGDDVSDLQKQLASKVGRLVWNEFPTGVAVTRAMHHGGPYPATTYPAHTSVGTAAIHRFQRPVCFQDVPDSRLPTPLRSANPHGVQRTVDGRLETATR